MLLIYLIMLFSHGIDMFRTFRNFVMPTSNKKTELALDLAHMPISPALNVGMI